MHYRIALILDVDQHHIDHQTPLHPTGYIPPHVSDILFDMFWNTRNTYIAILTQLSINQTLLHDPLLQPMAQGPLPQFICSLGIVVELQKLLDIV